MLSQKGISIIVIIILVAIFLGAFFLKNYGIKFSNDSSSPTSNFPSSTPTPTATPTPTPIQVYIPPQTGNKLRVPILMYHYVGASPKEQNRETLEVSPEKFTEQMQYLSENGYNSINLTTLFQALKKQTTLPDKPIIITFDDGYIDFYYNAFPILKRFNIKATQFLPTGLINTSYYLTWNQVLEIHSSGLVDFEAHSVHHYNLNSLGDSQLNTELTKSKDDLANKLGRSVNFIAYPYGIANERVQSFTEKAGYLGALGTWSSTTQSEGTILMMPRIRIGGQFSLEQFKKVL